MSFNGSYPSLYIIISKEPNKFVLFFRNLRLFFGLMLSNTSLTSKSKKMFLIKKEALDSAVLDAFLESAPQFVLQSSIVLWTGNICEYALYIFLTIYITNLKTFSK